MTFNQKDMENAVHKILENIGEDPTRQGLEKTPYRVAQMFRELTRGYHESPEKLINKVSF